MAKRAWLGRQAGRAGRAVGRKALGPKAYDRLSAARSARAARAAGSVEDAYGPAPPVHSAYTGGAHTAAAPSPYGPAPRIGAAYYGALTSPGTGGGGSSSSGSRPRRTRRTVSRSERRAAEAAGTTIAGTGRFADFGGGRRVLHARTVNFYAAPEPAPAPAKPSRTARAVSALRLVAGGAGNDAAGRTLPPEARLFGIGGGGAGRMALADATARADRALPPEARLFGIGTSSGKRRADDSLFAPPTRLF